MRIPVSFICPALGIVYFVCVCVPAVLIGVCSNNLSISLNLRLMKLTIFLWVVVVFMSLVKYLFHLRPLNWVVFFSLGFWMFFIYSHIHPLSKISDLQIFYYGFVSYILILPTESSTEQKFSSMIKTNSSNFVFTNCVDVICFVFI